VLGPSNSRRGVSLLVSCLVGVLLVALAGCGLINGWLGPMPAGCRPITNEEAASIMAAQDAAAKMCQEVSGQYDAALVQTAATWLRQQTDVSEVYVSDDDTIWIEYSCGLVGAIYPPSADQALGASAVSALEVSPLMRAGRLPIVHAQATVTISPSAKRALALIFDDVRKPSARLADVLLEAGYPLEVCVGEDFNLTKLGSLGDYGVIYINTHGAAGPFAAVTGTTWIVTGEKTDDGMLATRWSALTTGVGIGSVPGTPGCFVMVNQRFLAKRHIVLQQALADAFLNAGAATYVGWTDTTYSQLAEPLSFGLLEFLKGSGATFSAAWKGAQIDLGLSQPYSIGELFPTTVLLDTNGNGTRSLQFQNGRGIWDPGDSGVDYTLDLQYRSKSQSADLVLVPSPSDQTRPSTSSLYTAHREAGDALCRSSLEGTNIENLGDLSGMLDGPEDVAVDPASGKLYVVGKDSGNVCRANLDGTSPEVLSGLQGLLNRPYAIALDLVHGKMYVSNEDERIIQANLDGTNPKDLGDMEGRLSSPVGLAVDTTNGKLYVACSMGSCAVKPGWVLCANLDGSGAENLGTLGGAIINPSGIALDVASGKMYVTDTVKGVVARANLDGTGSESFGDLGGKLHEPTRIALDLLSRKMYITNWSGTHWVTRANLDGTESEELGTKDAALANQVGIVLYREP
jgi:hypothetical protein